MRTKLMVGVSAAVIALGALATPNKAEAHWNGWWLPGAVIGGVAIGAAIASTNYYYGYGPYYYGYGPYYAYRPYYTYRPYYAYRSYAYRYRPYYGYYAAAPTYRYGAYRHYRYRY